MLEHHTSKSTQPNPTNRADAPPCIVPAVQSQNICNVLFLRHLRHSPTVSQYPGSTVTLLFLFSSSGDWPGGVHLHRQDEGAAQLLPGVPRRGDHQRVDGPHLHQHAARAHHHQRRVGPQDAHPGKKEKNNERHSGSQMPNANPLLPSLAEGPQFCATHEPSCNLTCNCDVAKTFSIEH